MPLQRNSTHKQQTKSSQHNCTKLHKTAQSRNYIKEAYLVFNDLWIVKLAIKKSVTVTIVVGITINVICSIFHLAKTTMCSRVIVRSLL